MYGYIAKAGLAWTVATSESKPQIQLHGTL